MELVILALVVSAAIVGWWHWQNNVKLVPLEEFGLPVVQAVLAFEDRATRESIMARGGMTYAEWAHMNKTRFAAIQKELDARR